MRVAKYYNNSDIRLEEMPVPTIGPGEILVKVIASGICGTDVMEWYRMRKAPPRWPGGSQSFSPLIRRAASFVSSTPGTRAKRT